MAFSVCREPIKRECAIQRNRLIHNHFQQLLRRGKATMTALVAWMRKLLPIRNVMIKNQTPWKEAVAS